MQKSSEIETRRCGYDLRRKPTGLMLGVDAQGKLMERKIQGPVSLYFARHHGCAHILSAEARG